VAGLASIGNDDRREADKSNQPRVGGAPIQKAPPPSPPKTLEFGDASVSCPMPSETSQKKTNNVEATEFPSRHIYDAVPMTAFKRYRRQSSDAEHNEREYNNRWLVSDMVAAAEL